MATAKTTHLHLPLSETLHEKLRAEARRVGVPATRLARHAVEQWLADAQRQAINREVMSYAAGVAGTTDDLDLLLEASAAAHLASADTARRDSR
jgi:hypothetical protein